MSDQVQIGDNTVHKAARSPLTGAGTDEIHGREVHRGWISGIHQSSQT